MYCFHQPDEPQPPASPRLGAGLGTTALLSSVKWDQRWLPGTVTRDSQQMLAG